jgi:hypothetical protein
MLPLAVFRSRQFSATNAVTFIVYAALGGVLFLLPIVLQQAAGYSPLRAGAALLPVTAIIFVLSARSGALAARIGPRLQLTVGPSAIAGGLGLLVRLDGPGSYATQVLPAMSVLGLGLAVTVAPLTATVLAAAPPEHAGVASAVNNDLARIGALIAVAVLPVVAGITGDALTHPQALTHGFHVAVSIAAASCACAGLLAGLTIRDPAGPGVPTGGEHRHCAVDGPPLRTG